VEPLPSHSGLPGSLSAHQREYALRTATGLRLTARLSQIWSRRDVLRMFVSRGLKVKYASSVLGYAWSLIEPALFIAIYFVVFGRIFHTKVQHYPLFIASTILPWLWFNATTQQSLGALRTNARLITSISLPREIYPLTVVGEKFIEFLLSLPVIVAVAAIFRVAPSRYLFAFPLAVLMELVLVTGVALLIASLNTILRDVQRGIGVVLRLLFYMTPVLYKVTNIHGSLRRVYELNPLVGIFELDRAPWFPKDFGDWRAVYISAVGCVLMLALGWWTFIRLERPVLKEL
jgi:ABC-2 type transport system permease protein